MLYWAHRAVVHPRDPKEASVSVQSLHTMGVGDIVDESFRLLRAYFVPFVGIMAVLQVPRQIILTLVSLSSPPDFTFQGGLSSGGEGAPVLPTVSPGWLAASSLGGLISLLLGVLLTGALAVAISRAYLAQPVSIAGVYAAALPKLGTLLLAGIIAVILVVMLWFGLGAAVALLTTVVAVTRVSGLILLVGLVATIAAISLFCRIVVGWVLVPQVIMLENRPALASFGRSVNLVAGYRWKTAGVLLLSWLLLVVLLLVPTALLGWVLGLAHLDATAIDLIVNLAQLVLTVVATPIPLAATTLLFYDLKIRKEAFDLEMLADQLRREPASLPL
jgi:hypothetical protein